MGFMTANNALAGTGGMRQPVHKDITFVHPTCPFYFIANVVLCDFSEANGATEFWLGSHAHTTSNDQVLCTAESKAFPNQIPGRDPTCDVKEDVVEQRRSIRPPVLAECRKGDIVIRDLRYALHDDQPVNVMSTDLSPYASRTWHAGMPNNTAEDRLMIALGYQVRRTLKIRECALTF